MCHIIICIYSCHYNNSAKYFVISLMTILNTYISRCILNIYTRFFFKLDGFKIYCCYFFLFSQVICRFNKYVDVIICNLCFVTAIQRQIKCDYVLEEFLNCISNCCNVLVTKYRSFTLVK